MKTVGIVSEYNPFHNGHKYHLENAKAKCGADFAVCIMSGSFVQRGEPAIFDKWTRTKMAIEGGADLIVELPTVYSCQPAEIFAYGAMKILNSMNIIDFLCFGSESGDINLLSEISRILYFEPIELKNIIKINIAKGFSYPKALSLSLSNYLKSYGNISDKKILENPNNTLGIEYLKSIIKLSSNIKPITIKRTNDYNDLNINNTISSASAIRRELYENGMSENLQLAVPDFVWNIINNQIQSGNIPISLNNLSDIMLYQLRRMKAEEMKDFFNANEGIENRIKKYALSCSNIEELLESVKVKRYTRANLQRLIIHMLIHITRSDTFLFKQNSTPAYIRVLGFNDKGKFLLKLIKEKCKYPIITKVADFRTESPELARLFELDILSTDVYSLASLGKNKKAGKDYYTSPIY